MLEGDKLYGGKPRKWGVRKCLDRNFREVRRTSPRQGQWKDVGEYDGHVCEEGDIECKDS